MTLHLPRAPQRALTLCWSAACALSWALASVALAQAPAMNHEAQRPNLGSVPAAVAPAYERSLELAVNEFQLGNFLEARTRFLEAHKLFPNARTLRALGMTEYELRNYAAAIEQLEQALASDVRPLDEGIRRQTEELLLKAKGYVATVHVQVKPGDASTSVDGAVIQLPPGRILLLPVGEHQLEFRADGYLTDTRHLSIKGGEDEHLAVSLLSAKPASSPERERRPLVKNPWFWSAIGVVVVGVVTGTAIALTRDRSETREAEPYTGSSGALLTVP